MMAPRAAPATISVELTAEQAEAACHALGRRIMAADFGDGETWHDGGGYDGCVFCNALVALRVAAGVTPTDWIRP
jgi:hypothetical protein